MPIDRENREKDSSFFFYSLYIAYQKEKEQKIKDIMTGRISIYKQII